MSTSQPMKRAAKAVLAPVLSYSDGQFATLQQRIGGLQARIESVQERFGRLESRVATDSQTVAELAATFGRTTERLVDELTTLTALLDAGDGTIPDLLRRCRAGEAAAEEELAKVLLDLAPGAADRIAGAHVGTDAGALGPGLAALLNWAGGHTGPAARSGVWFNPAVTVAHDVGAVRANDVNERIVEVPYALGAAVALPPGSLVLDFGAAESTLALSLASLGLEVIAADLRPYPLAHPHLRSVVGPVESWDGPERPLDAVFCVSALEHVGLGAYGEDASATDLDRVIVEAFARWLRPGGELVFTAPYGAWHVDDLQRVYDDAHLATLLDGWEVQDRRICVQTGRGTWELASGDVPAETWADGTRGVVLLRATPRA